MYILNMGRHFFFETWQICMKKLGFSFFSRYQSGVSLEILRLRRIQNPVKRLSKAFAVNN